MARSKRDKGDAGSSGAAILNNAVVIIRGRGGIRKGLIGESGGMGEYGNCMEWGDVGEVVGILCNGTTGWIRRRGAVRKFVVGV